MPLWKNKAYNLTESTIRYAMANSKSNKQAARFLKISYPCYRKYAKMYKDEETGKNLFDLHKNQAGKGMKKVHKKTRGKKGLKEILEGKHPKYSPQRLKKRLVEEGFREECCERCGFDERRLTDYTVPLILVWKDMDKTNHKDENLELMCYNCFYLTQGNLFKKRRSFADRTDFRGYRNVD